MMMSPKLWPLDLLGIFITPTESHNPTLMAFEGIRKLLYSISKEMDGIMLA